MRTHALYSFCFVIMQLSINNEAQTVFNIGNLLPERNYSLAKNGNIFDDSGSLITLESNITKAINFASEALEKFFLENYNCRFDLNPSDTRCDVAYGTNSFFELVKDIKRTLLVFIGSCESTIKPIAESVQFFNLTLLSYTETDPTFSDRTKYNGFYRLVPSEEQHNFIRVHLMKKYNWSRVGTIYLTKAKYNLAHNFLIRDMDKMANIVFTRSILENQTTEQYDSILKEFIQNDVKILIGLFDIPTTIRLFCQIYKNGMYGENYQWIILGSYSSEKILSKYQNETDCTVGQLIKALNGTLKTKVVEYSYEFDLKYQKKNIKESNHIKLEREYEKLVNSYMSYYRRNKQDEVWSLTSKTDSNIKCRNSFFHGYAFDGILAIFKVFITLIENNKFDCSNYNFTRNIDWFTNLNDAFNKISFKGVTGHVAFKNASRIGQIKLVQLIGKEIKNLDDDVEHELNEKLILVHDQNKNQFVQINEIVWHGKNPPKDQTIKVKLMYELPNSMLIGAAILSTCGIILAIGFLIFNIKYRKHRFIKMSSPNLNNLIIIGCLMSYLSIFFLNEHKGLMRFKFFNQYICVIRLWLLTIGFSLAFGAMFSKTYRVHAILTNSKFTKKVIKDYKLFGLVVFLLVIEMLMLTSWQLLDPLQLIKKPYDIKRDGEKMFFVENFVCESNYMKIWLAGLFSYKSFLIIFGCFFAYETRHVTIAALNDSKYIGISVYNVLIMCTAGSAISFIVHNKNSSFILITLFIFACTTITLCLVFIPKVIQVKKDPIGKKKQRPKTFKKTIENRTGSLKYINTDELDCKISHLIQENRNKETLLEQINTKIEILLLAAKAKGFECVQECLRILNTDDIEVSKLIEKLNLLTHDFSTEPSEKKLKKKNSREKITHSNSSTSVKLKYSGNIDTYTEEHTGETNYENNQSLNKRKFNPPPHIVDLQFNNNENNSKLFFKIDI
ncbi:unnamed protein product [Brachionus calyciflorus]|uniref:G-protein coupled receptors family 3 profile domain-containing protein n=1 Tax=Brachionus calyciflorus TaxID=104777 RepID=A0A813MF38_9BILA|nr:unnamed protein product [Brachionus calyciflorus]